MPSTSTQTPKYESLYCIPSAPSIPEHLALTATLMLLGWALELMRDAAGSTPAEALCLKREAERTLQCVSVYVRHAEVGCCSKYSSPYSDGPATEYLRRALVLLSTGHEVMAVARLVKLRDTWAKQVRSST